MATALTLTPQPQVDRARRDALVSRLLGAAIGAFDLFSVYLGERLGLYASATRVSGCRSKR